MIIVAELVTSDELARELHVSRRTITRWAAEKIITPELTLPGGGYRWNPDDVRRQLREHRERR